MLSEAIKRNKGVLKTAVDPLGLGLGDAVFGADKGPDYSKYDEAQQTAIDGQKAAYDDFVAAGPTNYDTGAPLTFEEYLAGNPLALQKYQQGDKLSYDTLSPDDMARLGDSAYNDISVDPRLANVEDDALRSLMERSKEGLTLQDEADIAKLQNDVNRQNKGRMGAIQQNMQSRGVSGSGMDLLAQMQASQDATEMEALASIEKAAQSQNNKRSASVDAGNLASAQRGQRFGEDAQKAAARDAIERFNTANMYSLQNKNVDTLNSQSDQNWQRANATLDRNTGVSNTEADANWQRNNATADRNTGARNNVTADNWSRTNATMDRNAGAQGHFNQSKMDASLGKSGLDYNWSVDQQNRQMAQEAQDKKGAMDKFGAILGVGGAVVGSAAGPQGAMAGYQVGKGAGGAVGSEYYDNTRRYYAHGGMVDDENYDTVPAMLSPGEIVIPRSISDDPVKSSEFVASENGDEMDAVGHLLAAMQMLNKRR